MMNNMISTILHIINHVIHNIVNLTVGPTPIGGNLGTFNTL